MVRNQEVLVDDVAAANAAVANLQQQVDEQRRVNRLLIVQLEACSSPSTIQDKGDEEELGVKSASILRPVLTFTEALALVV